MREFGQLGHKFRDGVMTFAEKLYLVYFRSITFFSGFLSLFWPVRLG